MQLVALAFDDITPLDLVGPLEVLSRLPDLRVTVATPDGRPATGRGYPLQFPGGTRLADVATADLLLVPGGFGAEPLRRDSALLAEIRRLAAGARLTASVCTGALLLGAAGLLRGLEATTHWYYADQLPAYGATYVERRIVDHGRIATAAGVSAGIDLALTLAAQLAGREVAERIQLSIEYDPEPPFSGGRPSTSDPAVLAEARLRYDRIRAASALPEPMAR